MDRKSVDFDDVLAVFKRELGEKILPRHVVRALDAALSVAEAAIRADEREACAKVAAKHHESSADGDGPSREIYVHGYNHASDDIAAAIRAREQ